MRLSLIVAAAVTCVCSPAQSRVQEEPASHARENLVTRTIQLEDGEWMEDAETARILRRLLTPEIGYYEFFSPSLTIVVQDTMQVVESFAAVVAHFDKSSAVAPRQVFLDTRFVETTNTGFWEENIASPAGAMKLGVGCLNAEDAATAMSAIRKDEKSRIIQAPKLIALDHHEASIFVEEDSSIAVEGGRSFGVKLVPHMVPGTDKLVLGVGDGDQARLILTRSGQTVVYRYVDAAEREVVVLVTPQTIQRPEEIEVKKKR